MQIEKRGPMRASQKSALTAGDLDIARRGSLARFALTPR